MGIASIAKTGLNYAGRLIFDDRFATEITKSIKNQRQILKASGENSFTEFHKQIKDAFIGAEKVTGDKKIFQSLKDSLKGYKTDVSALWKSDKKLLSKLGGTLKGLGKRAPLIGTALMVVFELPNIFKATKEGGLVNGALEVGKSGVRIAAGIAGGAIGTAILGPLGSIPGFIIGDLLGKLVVGKSYSEKKAAEQEKIAQAINTSNQAFNTAITNMLPQMTMSPQELMLLQQMLYGNNSNFPYYAISNQQNKLNVTG